MNARTPVPVYLVQAAGFLLLAIAWWGTSGSGKLETQVDWLVLAVAALLLSLASCLGWLFFGHRRIALRRAQLAAALRAKFDAVPAGAGAVRTDPVAATSMTHFHRAECQLVRGKDVRPGPRATHEQAGRTPCGVCRP